MRDRQGRTLIDKNPMPRYVERTWRTVKIRDSLDSTVISLHSVPTREHELDMHVLDNSGSCRCAPVDRNEDNCRAPYVWEHNQLVHDNG